MQAEIPNAIENVSQASSPNRRSPEATKLPFTLQELKAAIPPHCFAPSVARSLSYFFLDIGIIAGLYALATRIDSWFFLPLFWLAQGTMFWALFVVGHDCGHRSFSKYKWLNDLVGHLAHTPILVPFHGWRISHRTHHQNTGNVDTDESWHPVSESEYNQMPGYLKILRFRMMLFLYPLYLLFPSRKGGHHFLPDNASSRNSEKADLITSTVCWTLMIFLLGFLTYQWGIAWLVKYYLMPYIVFVMWLDLVTYLHHTDPDVPWYRDEDWYFLKGALSTVDRDYGFINEIHHNIGTHIAHHVFSTIPHYHLKTATEAIKPILGTYYREAEQSIWQAFWRSGKTCHFVPDVGSPVHYQSNLK